MFDSTTPTEPVTEALPDVCSAAAASCKHCGNVLPDAAADSFCCSGCRTLYELLASTGLQRYYALRGTDVTAPAPDLSLAHRDYAWLEPLAKRVRDSTQPIELTLKLQGLRCAACVWLIQELFERHRGALRVLVNSGRGRLSLSVDARFPLREFVQELERFGYLLGELGESEAESTEARDQLLLRTVICLALAGNSMMFAAAIYLGLQRGPLYALLHAINFGCATLAVLIGAPVFMGSAWQALRRGILHLDLPIALGIALSYAAALWSFVSGHAQAAYYDSLAIFIALMLLGHWLKVRIVVDNQKQLLANDGLDKLWARRVDGESVTMLPASELGVGDVLLIPPGDLIPVPAELLERNACCSLDWINGESEPRLFAQGSELPAGAFNAENSPLRVRARATLACSGLLELFDKAVPREQSTRAGHAFSVAYVTGVLLTAAGALALWTWLSGSFTRGLEVATAVCVVTCPCAIGIATPLAQDFILAGLRRAGLFVRAPSFLDRARAVRRIVFDKTGTLTTGRLQLAQSVVLDALDHHERDALYTLAVASSHPKSVAVARALQYKHARLIHQAHATETTGQGVEAELAGKHYRLGQPSWALSHAADSGVAADLVFSCDGQALCTLHTTEHLRDDAGREVRALERDGYELWILSGDEPSRVTALAARLGISAEHALGGYTPQGKAAWIAEHDRKDMLMIGDGINDSLAVTEAFASGTPAIDRALMAWRTDFYLVSAGLHPIRLALRAAQRLADVVRRNQIFAITYNVGVVSLALAGWMKPWLAAVLMPASSIAVLLATSISLSARSRLWRS